MLDRVLFKFPSDKELQFPALAVLQHFVETYEAASTKNDVSGGQDLKKLKYAVSGMTDEDWKFFLAAGVKLKQRPVPQLDGIDRLVDLSDEKILAFHGSGKHAVNVCNILAGTDCKLPFPKLKTVRPLFERQKFGVLEPSLLEADFITQLLIKLSGSVLLYEDDLSHIQDGMFMGVVGRASRGTALASAMGLGVIEIVPVDRERDWLSKWSNRLYRAVWDRGDSGRAQSMKSIELICNAVDSIQKEVENVCGKQCAVG